MVCLCIKWLVFDNFEIIVMKIDYINET